ncbi:MAG TPA: ABC transporter permease, partial [bacterium]|nr:ABC transporter permease [bacterium]
QAKTTVVMVTHKPEDLVAANKVAFLAKEDAPGDTTGGHVVYNDIRTGLEEYFTVDELTDIYAQLAPDGDVTRSKPVTTWARQWLKLAPQKPPPPPKASLEPDRVSAGRQFWWLLMRALQLRLNQPKELLGRLLGLPFVFAAIIFLAFRPLVVGALFTIAIAAILCAMINAGLEIVSERAIFNRERMVNLRLGPYVASKLTLQALLGGIQAFVLTGLLTLAYAHGQGNTSPWVRLAGDWWQPALFVWYLIWSASIMVLVISAWAKNAEKANLLLSGLLLVQLILSGVVSKISSLQFEFASYLSYSRWGTEGLARIQDGFPEPDPAGSYVSLSPRRVRSWVWSSPPLPPVQQTRHPYLPSVNRP